MSASRSAYETARLQNSARNNAELRRLGLVRLPAQKRKAPARRTKKKKKTLAREASGPLRRSTRHRGRVRVHYDDADDSDSDSDSNSDSDSDSDGEWSDSATPPPPKRLRRTVSVASAATTSKTAASKKGHNYVHSTVALVLP